MSEPAHAGKLPLLSILTPAIPERLSQANRLAAEIESQRNAAGITSADVEHLIFCDTRGARTVGEKRDALLRLARGRYVAFCDDDDQILEGYVASLIAATRYDPNPDVITFRQRVTYCGKVGEVDFALGHENEPFAPGGVAKRAPWHVCAFLRDIALSHHFPATNYGEDWAWARHVVADCRTSLRIDAVLHHYIHDPATTAAPAPATSQ